MKDLGKASHILGIKLLRDHQKKNVGLILGIIYRSDSCQVQYARFQEKICFFQSWNTLSSNQCPKTHAEIERMREISYALQ